MSEMMCNFVRSELPPAGRYIQVLRLWTSLTTALFSVVAPQKKIMIIICCVILGVVLASSIGGTLGM